jgi:UDP-N-acetylmuramoyl-L-alanyl-D-glutamate--2,6-diaminopimelate ligase
VKSLADILSNFEHKIVQGNDTVHVNRIVFNSKEVKPGDLFVAIVGHSTDGHKYIVQAFEAGAEALVCEKIPESIPSGKTVVQVKNAQLALAAMAANYYGHPSETMKVVGITGTNGKTTTATMLYNVFRQLGYPCGLFSTVKVLINDEEMPATHTTPDPVTIQHHMAQMRDAGCEYCFMEVSSHGIEQYRTEYIHFNVGVFTNITQDHLDYHETFANYLNAKKRFFDRLPPDAYAIYNADDRNGHIMMQNCNGKKRSYALKRPADYKARLVRMEMGGMLLEIEGIQFWTLLTGLFNAYNLMAIYATATCFTDDKQELLAVLSKQNSVRGRFERIISEQKRYAIVDYAHTPDAVANVLSTIKEVRTGNEKVIVVIGAGGNRDKTKRPIMAANACKYADTVIFTSDNPRFEKPQDIIDEMKVGIPEHYTGSTFTIEQREEAIKVACGLAQPEDIILIAGKGHETYQEVEGKRHHFDDREIILNYLK